MWWSLLDPSTIVYGLLFVSLLVRLTYLFLINSQVLCDSSGKPKKIDKTFLYVEFFLLCMCTHLMSKLHTCCHILVRFGNLHYISKIGALFYVSCCSESNIYFAVIKLEKFANNNSVTHIRPYYIKWDFSTRVLLIDA